MKIDKVFVIGLMAIAILVIAASIVDSMVTITVTSKLAPANSIEVTCVWWQDANSDSGWKFSYEYDPDAPIVSCGQMISDKGNYIIMAMDKDLTNDMYNGFGSIPKKMVTRTEKVFVPRKEE